MPPNAGHQGRAPASAASLLNVPCMVLFAVARLCCGDIEEHCANLDLTTRIRVLQEDVAGITCTVMLKRLVLLCSRHHDLVHLLSSCGRVLRLVKDQQSPLRISPREITQGLIHTIGKGLRTAPKLTLRNEDVSVLPAN